MAECGKENPQLDWDVYVENRSKIPPEVLRPYLGQWLAWSLDGTHVVASDPDLEGLASKLAALGLATDEVLHEALVDL